MSQNENVSFIQKSGGSIMNNIKVLGIDLAKNVFQLHGTDSNGKGVLRKRMSREKLVEFMANLSPCLVGVEACGGAHYWSRLFVEMGHRVKMMSPQFVKPYVKSNKNDAKDAEAISEAVTRPTMRFVPIKNMTQQDVLLLHRAKELAVKQRTAQANQIRGFLAEYGIIIAQGIHRLVPLPEIPDANEDKLSSCSKKYFYSYTNNLNFMMSRLSTTIERAVNKQKLIPAV